MHDARVMLTSLPRGVVPAGVHCPCCKWKMERECPAAANLARVVVHAVLAKHTSLVASKSVHAIASPMLAKSVAKFVRWCCVCRC